MRIIKSIGYIVAAILAFITGLGLFLYGLASYCGVLPYNGDQTVTKQNVPVFDESLVPKEYKGIYYDCQEVLNTKEELESKKRLISNSDINQEKLIKNIYLLQASLNKLIYNYNKRVREEYDKSSVEKQGLTYHINNIDIKCHKEEYSVK